MVTLLALQLKKKHQVKVDNITEPAKETIEEVKAEETLSPSVKNNNLKLSPVVRKIVSENQFRS
jgi:hypothetical protein